MMPPRLPLAAPLLLLLLLLLLTPTAPASAGTLGCALTLADWSRITVALSQEYYFPTFNDAGDCSASVPAGVNASESTSLTVRYGGCSEALDSIVSTSFGQTCQTTLAATLWQSATQTLEDNVGLAGDMCAGSLNDLLTNFLCLPLDPVAGCPEPTQVALLAPFGACFSAVLNATYAQKAQFFGAGEDLTCIQQTGVCNVINAWASCPATVAETFAALNPAGGAWTCSTLFAPVDYRCNLTFAYAHDTIFCPPESTLQKYFLIIVLVPTIVPTTLACLACLAYCAWKRSGRGLISNEELLSQGTLTMGDALVPGAAGPYSPDYPAGKTFMHPELHVAVQKQMSKYRGVVFDPERNVFMFNGKVFEDESSAARAAYLSQALTPVEARALVLAGAVRPAPGFVATPPTASMMSSPGPAASALAFAASPSSPRLLSPLSPDQGSFRGNWPSAATLSPPTTDWSGSPGAMSPMSPTLVRAAPAPPPMHAPAQEPLETPEQRTARRKKQLVEFYEFWSDDDKADIPGKVDYLFQRHEFAHVARAVLSKYGVLPLGCVGARAREARARRTDASSWQEELDQGVR